MQLWRAAGWTRGSAHFMQEEPLFHLFCSVPRIKPRLRLVKPRISSLLLKATRKKATTKRAVLQQRKCHDPS